MGSRHSQTPPSCSLVYSTDVHNEQSLHANIMAACEAVHTTHGIFYRFGYSLRRRAEACIQAGSCYFENFLRMEQITPTL